MNLKVKHQITENTLRGGVTPETNSGVTNGLLKANSAVAISRVGVRVTTSWSTVVVRRLLVLVATVVRRVVLLFRSLQIHTRLVGFHSLDGSSLNSTACHEVEFSLGTKVLKVFARIKEDVHLFNIILGKLFQRSSWFTSDGDTEDTIPNSPNWTLLPISNCSTRQEQVSLTTPFTVPRVNTPLWSEMCFTKSSKVSTFLTWFLA